MDSTRQPSRSSQIRSGIGGARPDVILATGSGTIGPLLEATRVVPIVFVTVADPVDAGNVDSLSRPGGNATGFMLFEYSLSGKWLELLKQIAPTVTRAAVFRDPSVTSGIGQFAVIQVEVSPINVRDAGEIERAVAAFAHSSNKNSGLIVAASALSLTHRDLIITLAALYELPRCLLATLVRNRRWPDLLRT